MSSDIFVLSFFSLFFNCLQIQGVRGGTTGQSVRILTYAHIIAPHHRFINCLRSLGLLSILAFIMFRAFVVGVCCSTMVCSVLMQVSPVSLHAKVFYWWPSVHSGFKDQTFITGSRPLLVPNDSKSVSIQNKPSKIL